ncbi:outer membrane beta-barrel protein [Flavobacterium aurantiibacter]|uniref:Outer membrane protein beta-barrel domain-containing protein n=1 Tax=Flavobacterium aurantiibacter TaxID=2023067 RepID=A0A255ZY72_9FLAO|nr:outer membrane beta-barrel protein [Flavobacterium aurantiibacter]OYQ46341.1 hypothetical protein CHX27_04655 [Flavobacterium aurantiibacter]
MFSVIALAAVSFANAQDQVGFAKGDLFLTGSLGYSTEKIGDLKNDELFIAPAVGYFVSENIAVGARVGYGTSTITDETTGADIDSNTLTFSGFGRYYTTPAANFSFFVEAAAGYNSIEIADAKSNGFNIGIAPGINYFLAKNFSIEATVGVLGYSTIKPDADGAESTDTFQLGLDATNLTFGLNYRF